MVFGLKICIMNVFRKYLVIATRTSANMGGCHVHGRAGFFSRRKIGQEEAHRIGQNATIKNVADLLQELKEEISKVKFCLLLAI
jgi:hypothetical protein